MKSKLRKRRSLRVGTKRFRRRTPAPPRRDAREAGVLVGGVHDPAEKAADRAASEVMAGNRVTSLAPATAAVHRACAGCEEEKKDKKDKTAKRSANGAPSVAAGAKAGRAGPKASGAIHAMGAGKPLSRADRAFFEPRFGRDLSGVRIHDGPAADRAARSIDARAFAYGSDIAFASGERERGGAHLLSHELAHVATGGEARRMVHRATIATADGDETFLKVPNDQKKDVQRALKLVEKSLSAKRCRDFFTDKCTGGDAETAKKTFDAATVYYMSDRTDTFGQADRRSAATDPHNIGYNQRAFDIGRWEVAATLLHELFHTCDLTRDDLREFRAEAAAESCGFYSPWVLSAAPAEVAAGDTITVTGYQFGQAQDDQHFVEMGGVRVSSYDRWEQPRGGSSVIIEFKVPQGVNAAALRAPKVDLAVVNHGIRSNTRSIKVTP